MPLYVNDGQSPIDSDGISALTHEGIDHTASPLDLLKLTSNHANAAGLANRATVTMTGTLALTDASPAFQFLDPDGVERIVTLPAYATTNPIFTIINTGLYPLRVEDAANVYVVDVKPDESARFASDGVGIWKTVAREPYSNPLLCQQYQWGGQVAGVNFLRVNGHGPAGGTGGGTIDAIGQFHIFHNDGIIDELRYVTSDNDSEPFEIVINGVIHSRFVTYADLNETGAVKLPAPITITAGDRMAIRVPTNIGQYVISARLRTTANPGYTIVWGGDITADDAYYDLAGDYNQTLSGTTENHDKTAILHGTGNLVSLAYACNGADIADQVDIVLNGLVAATVTLANGSTIGASAHSGLETLSIPFSDGDTLSIRGKDHMNMNNSVWSILTDVAGTTHQFKGDPGGVGGGNGWFVAWAANSNQGGLPPSDNDTMAVVHNRGRLAVSWDCELSPTSLLLILKNRNEMHTYDWTGVTQGTALLPICFEPGDRINLGTEDGSSGDTNVIAFVIND
jgi:hypothetical protein